MTYRKTPAAVVAELQQNLDILSKGLGIETVDLSPVVKSVAKPQQRSRVVKFDRDTKRAITREDPLADENLGTRTSRDVRKAENEVGIYSGFVSKNQIESTT